MTDDSGFRILCDELKFDDWGLCLDVGHLINRLGNCTDERKSIDRILNIIQKYPRDMRNKIDVVHLHMSLSSEYVKECKKYPTEFKMTNDDHAISMAYDHVCKIDQHRPFTDPSCVKIVNALSPRYVTHEISAPSPDGRLLGFGEQRSLFL
jgi:hypothetical protein